MFFISSKSLLIWPVRVLKSSKDFFWSIHFCLMGVSSLIWAHRTGFSLSICEWFAFLFCIVAFTCLVNWVFILMVVFVICFFFQLGVIFLMVSAVVLSFKLVYEMYLLSSFPWYFIFWLSETSGEGLFCLWNYSNSLWNYNHCSFF